MEGPNGALIPINSQISLSEGIFLERIVKDIRPGVSLEVGVAFGVSSLFICGALKEIGGRRHIAIDLGPIRKEGSNELDRFGLGIYNLERCGYSHLLEIWESPSELALPELLRRGRRIQFAFIDGWHSFDHTLVDFFYVNKMLDVGGVVAFHDAVHPNVRKVIRHVMTYPAYRLYGASEIEKPVFSTTRKGPEKAIAYLLFLIRRFTPRRPNCVALMKIEEDKRPWQWFVNF
ncbi:MAG TPA: class I SAM-dependent methyltransferase [Syntrophales bacterium]|nr:class I SAM-dependent methyltransferase [Syntrophales bacterium]HOM08229.1 class I SAM-dependent methyltransferase [Syntrophales bacterium]